MMQIPTVTLNDDTLFPQVGLGTYGLNGDEGIEAVVAAGASSLLFCRTGASRPMISGCCEATFLITSASIKTTTAEFRAITCSGCGPRSKTLNSPQ